MPKYTAFTDGGCFTRQNGTTTPSYFSFQIWQTSILQNYYQYGTKNNKPTDSTERFYLRSLIPKKYQNAKTREGKLGETINILNDSSVFIPFGCSIYNDKGKETNNIAEYAAMYYCLQRILSLKLANVEIFSDSQLIINQLTGKYKCNQNHLIPWYKVTANLLTMADVKLTWTPRENITQILGH